MSIEDQIGRMADALERIAVAFEASTSRQQVSGPTEEVVVLAGDVLAKAADKASGRTRRTSRGSTEKETAGSPEPQAGSEGASTEQPSASTQPAEEPAPTQNTAPAPAADPAPTATAPEVPPAGRSIAEIQTLATSIAERFGREKALAVVNSYAPRVSAIPEDKRAECYDQLKKVEADLEALS